MAKRHLTAAHFHVNVIHMKLGDQQTANKRPYRMSKRALAAEETGQRILTAAMESYMAWWLEDLTLEDVATRAGVTVQTVLRRFGSKSGLIQAVGERLYREVTSQRSQAPVGNITGAVANLMDHYEAVGDLVIRTLAQEGRHEVLRTFTERGRAVHRAWVETTFAPFLAVQPAANRVDVLTRLIVVTDVYVWKLLRRDMGLSREQAEHAIAGMVSAVTDRDDTSGD